jgi:1-acyl-sn-glycerol-3-phosphate acyltransferase
VCAPQRKMEVVPDEEAKAPPDPATPAPIQRRPGLLGRAAHLALGIAGWRVVGTAPELPKCVVIFAPHTSNWDFPLLLAVRAVFARRVHYLAKHTLFRFPVAGLLRSTGAIAVEREHPHHLVGALTKVFRERSAFWLAMSPEGTRHATDHWRSGFYHVARGAGVPVVPAFIDAQRKECGLGEPIGLSGDVEADLDQLRAFYRGKQGIRPERAGEIRFRDVES